MAESSHQTRAKRPAWKLRRAEPRDERRYFGSSRRAGAGATLLGWLARQRLAVSLLWLAAAAWYVWAIWIAAPGLHEAYREVVVRRSASVSQGSLLSTDEAASLRQETRSPAYLEAVAANLGATTPQEKAALGLRLERSLQVGAHAGVSTIKIKAVHEHSREASRWATAAAEALVATRRKTRRGANQLSATELSAAEKELELFRARNNVTLLDPQRASTRAGIERLEREVRHLKTRSAQDAGASMERAQSELRRQRALLDSLDRLAARHESLEEEVDQARDALAGGASTSAADRRETAGPTPALRLSLTPIASGPGASSRGAAIPVSSGRSYAPFILLAFATSLAALAFVGWRRRPVRGVAELSDLIGAPLIALEKELGPDVS